MKKLFLAAACLSASTIPLDGFAQVTCKESSPGQYTCTLGAQPKAPARPNSGIGVDIPTTTTGVPPGTPPGGTGTNPIGTGTGGTGTGGADRIPSGFGGGGTVAVGNPIVGVATQYYPVPQHQTQVVNGTKNLMPGDVGGPTRINHPNCSGITAWQFNVPPDVILGNWTRLQMGRGHSMSYAFNPRTHAESSGIGRWQLAPHGAFGPKPPTHVTISEFPCDWNRAKAQANTPCYGSATFYAVSGMLDIEAYKLRTGQRDICVLEPNKTYYLNIRWEDTVNRPGVDSCTSQLTQGTQGYCAMVISP